MRTRWNTIPRMQPAYDTWYETDEIGNNNGRGRGGEREREFGGLRRKEEKEEGWRRK